LNFNWQKAKRLGERNTEGRNPPRWALTAIALFPLGVTGCRDDASRATDGLPSAADAPLQRSELAKSANSRHRRLGLK
jgi:hypothetical protein